MTDKELLQALYTTGRDQHRCLGCGHEHRCSTHGCAIHRAAIERIKELLAEVEALRHPSNEPLTLEELHKMVGEPIYIVDFELPDASGWEICEEIHTDAWCNCDNVAAYGKAWAAYRRKPEAHDD